MSEIVPLTVAMPVVRQILFKALGKVSRKLQRKFFPLQYDRIVVNVGEPSIYMNRTTFANGFSVPIRVANYTTYEVQILSCEGTVGLGSYRFLRIRRNGFVRLGPGQEGSYSIEMGLTDAEMHRIEKLYIGFPTVGGGFELDFVMFSVYGLESLRRTLSHNVELRIDDRE